MARHWLWDGTLSPGDFEVAAMNLLDKWATCCSTSQQWRWEPCQKLPWGVSCNAYGYLSLEHLIHNPNERHDVAEDEFELEEEKGPLDPATLGFSYLNFHLEGNYTKNGIALRGKVSGSHSVLHDESIDDHHSEPHVYTLHIVYNNSYKVPMLLFRGHSIDGKPLELEEIKKDLPSSSCQLLEHSKWTFLTQEEHPYLYRPWYALHPCGTSQWMSFLFSSRTSLNATTARILEHSLTQTVIYSDNQGKEHISSVMEETTAGFDSSSKVIMRHPHVLIP